MPPSSPSILFNENRLNYVSQDALHIPPVLARMYGYKVTSLDLSYNRLTTLDGLQYFKNLNELMLDNNQLDDNIYFPCISSLHTLSMNNNKISELEYFLPKVKDSFPNIKYLSILGNTACPNQISDVDKGEEDYQRYRYFVLYMLPNLEFLDSRTVTLQERSVGQQRGMYMKIVRPSNNYIKEKENDNRKMYSPLPAFQIKSHHGIYGKCMYRYSGKHSEGNRFIRNDDL
ncbi:leucine-rich melanocyte differentiation-associated protein-like [Rhodnius prolixus]|uniref:Putative u2 small nuclear ribonucleoprotein a n=2 Tax=Rhodnius TaxID=13248 RepID=R4FMJ7_RHOPR